MPILIALIMISSIGSLMGMNNKPEYPIKFKETRARILNEEIHGSLLALNRSAAIIKLPTDLAVCIAAYLIAPGNKNSLNELERHNLIYEFLHQLPSDQETKKRYENYLLGNISHLKKWLYSCATRDISLFNEYTKGKIPEPRPTSLECTIDPEKDTAPLDHTIWQTPLHLTARYNDLPLMKKLIEKHKADINALNPVDKTTPIMRAAQHGSPEMVRYLLDRKASTRFEDENKNTVFYYAASNKKHGVALLKLLHTKKPLINRPEDSTVDGIILSAAQSGNSTVLDDTFKQHPNDSSSFLYSSLLNESCCHFSNQLIEKLVSSDNPMSISSMLTLIKDPKNDTYASRTLCQKTAAITFKLFKLAVEDGKPAIAQWLIDTHAISGNNNYLVGSCFNNVSPSCMPLVLSLGLTPMHKCLDYLANMFIENKFNDQTVTILDHCGKSFFNDEFLTTMINDYHTKNGYKVALEPFWHLYRCLPEDMRNPLYFVAVPELFERCMNSIAKKDHTAIIDKALEIACTLPEKVGIGSLANPAHWQIVNLIDSLLNKYSGTEYTIKTDLITNAIAHGNTSIVIKLLYQLDLPVTDLRPLLVKAAQEVHKKHYKAKRN